MAKNSLYYLNDIYKYKEISNNLENKIYKSSLKDYYSYDISNSSSKKSTSSTPTPARTAAVSAPATLDGTATGGVRAGGALARHAHLSLDRHAPVFAPPQSDLRHQSVLAQSVWQRIAVVTPWCGKACRGLKEP